MTSQEEEAGLGQRKVSARFVYCAFNLIMCLLGVYLGDLQMVTGSGAKPLPFNSFYAELLLGFWPPSFLSFISFYLGIRNQY